jgi:ParB/RepB/Spo0J family partition protein
MPQLTVEELKRPEARSKAPRINVDKKFNTLKALVVEYVKVDELYPNAYNPNRQSEREFELLLKSMEEDGFTQPVIAQKKTKMIVDGEHRWRAANRLGMKEIPVVFVDMTDAQMKISTLRHNRARGSEDIELTIKVLQDLRTLGALDHAVDSLNMSERELTTLIDDLSAPELMAGAEFSAAWLPSDITQTPDKTFSKSGETHVSQKTKILKNEKAKIINNSSSLMEMGDKAKNQSVEFLTVTIIVNGDQAKMVRRTLGENPAEMLLRICALEVSSKEELLKEITTRTFVNQYNSWFRKTFEEVLSYVPKVLVEDA